jgi:hypothetical protein
MALAGGGVGGGVGYGFGVSIRRRGTLGPGWSGAGRGSEKVVVGNVINIVFGLLVVGLMCLVDGLMKMEREC